MNRATVSILIEDEIRGELDKDRKAAMHLKQKTYWEEHYSDRISQATFHRIYTNWRNDQVKSA